MLAPMQPAPDRLPPSLPAVVHVGFAGSRLLYGSERAPAAQAEAFDAALLPALVQRLQELPRASASRQGNGCAACRSSRSVPTR